MNNTTMTIRTDKDVKKKAQTIFAELGIDMSTAVNVFLRQAVMHNGFPFELTLDIPNKITEQAIINAENGIDMHGPFDSVADLMGDLNA